MSKLTDYSKFDHLDTDSDDDDDDDDEGRQQQSKSSTTVTSPAQVLDSTAGPSAAAAAAAADATVGGGIFTRHPEHSNRFVYEYPKGNPVYSWEQTLDSVTLFIPTPPDEVTQASELYCRIQPHRLQVGLHDDEGAHSPFFMDEPTAGTVDIHNSTWTWENNVLTMELFKANKGVVWRAVTLGYSSANNNSTTTAAQLDPFQLEQEQKRLLLERWQEENPGMDFRDAEINGSVPDPRTYMGGVRHD